MKKSLMLLSVVGLFLSPVAAFAENLQIFHRPDQVVAVVNETGGWKLNAVFDAFAFPENDWAAWASSDGEVKVSCKRTDLIPLAHYSCTFQFKRSAGIEITGNEMRALLGTIQPNDQASLDVSFANGQNDEFQFRLLPTGLEARSIKR